MRNNGLKLWAVFFIVLYMLFTVRTLQDFNRKMEELIKDRDMIYSSFVTFDLSIDELEKNMQIVQDKLL